MTRENKNCKQLKNSPQKVFEHSRHARSASSNQISEVQNLLETFFIYSHSKFLLPSNIKVYIYTHTNTHRRELIKAQEEEEEAT